MNLVLDTVQKPVKLYVHGNREHTTAAIKKSTDPQPS